MKTELSKHSGQQMGRDQLLRYFEKSLAKPGNYVRMAKQYLNYLIKEEMPLGKISLSLFAEGYSAPYKTAARKIISFAESHHITHVYDDSSPNLQGSALVLDFLAEAQISKASKETYNRSLNEFEVFLRSGNLQMSRKSVLLYLDRKGDTLSPFTLNLYLSAIKQFTKYCILKRREMNLTDDEVFALNDIIAIRSFKTDSDSNYHKETLSADEINMLIKQCEDAKEKLVLALLAYQALRTIEVTRLRWSDFIQKDKKHYLAILGKGRKVRELVPVLPSCLKIIKYYHYKMDYPSGDTPMFGFNKSDSVRKIVNKHLKRAGLKREKVSAHSLRHSVAQIMTEKGVPKPMIQRFLRHKHEATTSIYTAKQEDKDFLNFDFGI